MWTAPWFVVHDAIKGSADGRDTLLSESMCFDNALILSMAHSLVDSHSGDAGAVTLGEIASEFGRVGGASPVFLKKALSSGARFVDRELDVCLCGR